jgi:hypothetical protein
MAENKKSFLFYCDVIHTVEKLTDEQAGKLLKHVLRYVNDLNPIPADIITEIAFEPIKQSLKRDLQKYDGIRIKNKENALKRWNKKDATASERIRTDTKNADSVIDSDININIFKYKKANDKQLIDELSKYKDKYSKDILNSFYRYWSEKNDKGKMRMALENTFEVEKRLITWENNNKKFNKSENKIEEKKIIW